MLKLALTAALVTITSVAWSLPHDRGVLRVADRDFFVGEITETYPIEGESRFFSWKYSNGLRHVMYQDDVLADQDVQFLETGVPASDLVGDPKGDQAEATNTFVDPAYRTPNHIVINRGPIDLQVFPRNSEYEYSARCARGLVEGDLNICRLTVRYPYASHIALIADDFFPGSLSEASSDFEQIVSRMVSIAICIDVTNSDLDLNNSENPLRNLEAVGSEDCYVNPGS